MWQSCQARSKCRLSMFETRWNLRWRYSSLHLHSRESRCSCRARARTGSVSSPEWKPPSPETGCHHCLVWQKRWWYFLSRMRRKSWLPGKLLTMWAHERHGCRTSWWLVFWDQSWKVDGKQRPDTMRCLIYLYAPMDITPLCCDCRYEVAADCSRRVSGIHLAQQNTQHKSDPRQFTCYEE